MYDSKLSDENCLKTLWINSRDEREVLIDHGNLDRSRSMLTRLSLEEEEKDEEVTSKKWCQPTSLPRRFVRCVPLLNQYVVI